MYRKLHNGQLSIKLHVPYGGTLGIDNRWVIFSSLMPWEELEETYAHRFNQTTGAPAKPVRLAFGTLFIKQRLGLSDEKTVEEIREKYIHAVLPWLWRLFQQDTVPPINDSLFSLGAAFSKGSVSQI